METTIKISVIMPVYNAAAHLEKSLQSLVSQTFFKNMELVLVDDGSTDGSSTILDQYATQYSAVQVFHIPNGGVSGARNLGLKKAVGEYVTFVDADDWVDPTCYQTMYAASKNADIVASGLYIQQDRGILLTIAPCQNELVIPEREAIQRFLAGELDVHVWNKLFRRPIASSVQFDSAIHIGEDKLYLYTCLLKSQTVSLIPQCFYHYYQNPSSVMRQAFSQKHFDDIAVGQHIINLTERIHPELVDHAQCMNINALCRILGTLSLSPQASAQYRQEYNNLLRQVRRFSLIKSIRCSSRKHWISLALAKVSPRLYGILRSNQRLKYRKG